MNAQVRATFGSGNRIVAGCMVNEGVLRKGCVLVVKRGTKVCHASFPKGDRFTSCCGPYKARPAIPLTRLPHAKLQFVIIWRAVDASNGSKILQSASGGLLPTGLTPPRPAPHADMVVSFAPSVCRMAACPCLPPQSLPPQRTHGLLRQCAQVVFEGPLTSLRRVKDDVKEVSHGLECGVRVDGFTSWREGDTMEAFAVAEKRRTLEEASQYSCCISVASSMVFVAKYACSNLFQSTIERP